MDIRKYNIPAHIDMEEVIKKKSSGDVTMTLRVNAGNIVDLTQIEYVATKKKYGDIKQTTGEQFSIAPSHRERSTGDAVWNDNSKSFPPKRKGGLNEPRQEQENKVQRN